MTRLKMEPGMNATTAVLNLPSPGANNNNNPTSSMVGHGSVNNNTQQLSLTSMDCYEDMFKEITKKLYGDDGLALIADPGDPTGAGSIVYDAEGSFRADGSLTLVTANGLPGTLVVQRRPTQDDKDDQLALAPSPTSVLDERWFESDDGLEWTTSKIARYNPAQKVFRCVDCDFVGFLSRVAEHWLGNHASLRVFQCPRCPYTSAWARCVRMHLTRQHGETLTDNSLWKENPVLEEVTKFLNNLKTRVEAKAETLLSGEKRYICQYCSYATDRRDLFNRHENIHRDEKPFQCFVCDKQFNRADHVKKHFTRMHRDQSYDINRIRKHFPKSSNSGCGVSVYPQVSKPSKQENTSAQQQLQLQQQQQQQLAIQQQQEQEALQQLQQQQQTAQQQLQQQLQEQQQQILAQIQEQTGGLPTDGVSIQLQTSSADGNVRSQTVTLQQVPHIAYFNPPSTPGQTGPLQGIQGVGGTKKEAKAKGQKKKKQYDKMYSCSYCPWQGVDNWCLKRHLNTHIKPFLCALCDYKAARSERLATHVLKVHNKRVCHKCSFLADDPESLAQHVQDSHQNPLVKTGFNCNLCQEYFELRADLEAHAILEHQKVIVQCDLCDFRTTDELSMEAHLREKHNLQPGMGAVAAAAAAAAAAGQQPAMQQHQQQHHQQQQLQQQQQQQQLQQQMQLSVPQSVMMQMPEPLPVIVDSAPPPPELVISDIPDHALVKQEITSYHIDEAITTVLTPDVTEPDKEPDTGCDICGCEFFDEVSIRRHKKCHEPRKVEPPPLRTSKTISRTYTCSTCSYNCATSRIMMQHQKVHSGFELECRVEGCFFSSPFENSLKEHIHSEHNDGTIRCLHCGYTVPSLIDFTFHWRNHHSAICSLCIGIYKSKYGMKEPEIHDLLLRTPIEMLNYSKVIDEDGLEGPMQADSEGEPLAKRSREELNSVFTSVTSYFNNPSISFLPRFIDITVSTSVKKKKRRRTKWNCRNTRGKFIRGTVRRLLSTRRDSHKPIYLLRQTSQPKCHSHACRYKFKRYVSSSKLALHKLWHHIRRPLIECDMCDQRFTYLYKALLHKNNCHLASLNQGRAQLSLDQNLQHQHAFRLNNNDHTRIIFKRE